MERNPLKGGQACGGDGHLKGSKQLCQGFDQHQVQVQIQKASTSIQVQIQKASTISTGGDREEKY